MTTASIGDVKDYIREQESYIEDFKNKPISMVLKRSRFSGAQAPSYLEEL